MPPHRAGPDAWVTAHILAELAKTIPIEQNDFLDARAQGAHNNIWQAPWLEVGRDSN